MKKDIVKFVEVHETISFKNDFSLRSIYISKNHVVSFREDHVMKERQVEGKLPEGILAEQQFTKMELSGGSSHGRFVVVVGSPEIIEQKLNLGVRDDI
jgi:hypothetical protein